MDFWGEDALKNLSMIPGPDVLDVNNSICIFMLT